MTGLATLPPEVRALRPVRTLEHNLARGRLPHALMLKGDDPLVLESVAQALASALLGAKVSPASHPDYFTLRPSGKARGIIVGQRHGEQPNTVRHLIRELNQTSNQGGYKVAVVYEADRLNPQAGNAFLKTLEEPPAQTLILLLTTRPYEVIETIRSRCFQFRIPLRDGSAPAPQWQFWLETYRNWIIWLHRSPEEARAQPARALFQAYGLISRFMNTVEAASASAWESQQATLPDSLTDEEIEALKTGLQKGVRDRLLIEIEEATREAAIHLSHHVPFPALPLTRAILALESITGLLALNMRDDTALEAFLLQSLRIWAG